MQTDAINDDSPLNQVFYRDPKEVNKEQRNATLASYFVDSSVVLANLFYLLRWIFDFGYAPEFALILRLAVLSLIVILGQRMILPKVGNKVKVLVTDKEVIIENYYTRQTIAGDKLQAVVSPNVSGYLTAKSYFLVVDDQKICLPSDLIDLEKCIDLIKERFKIDVLTPDQAQCRGLRLLPVRALIAMLFITLFFGLALFQIELNFDGAMALGLSAVTHIVALVIFYFMTALVFVSPGMHYKRVNIVFWFVALPMIVWTTLLLLSFIELSLTESVYRDPLLPIDSKSVFAELAPPEPFVELVRNRPGELDADERQKWEDAFSQWSVDERLSYEKLLLEMANYEEIKPVGRLETEWFVALSNRRLIEVRSRLRFWQSYLEFFVQKDTNFAILKLASLMVAEMEQCSAELPPVMSLLAANAFRDAAYSMALKYAPRISLDTCQARQLTVLVAKIESAQQCFETLLFNLKQNWLSDIYYMKHLAGAMNIKGLRMPLFPDPQEPEIVELATAIFDAPVGILVSFEDGKISFGELMTRLKDIDEQAKAIVRSWEQNFLGQTLMPYRLKNLLGSGFFAPDSDFNWVRRITELMKYRQKFHLVGYVAAIEAWVEQQGGVPETLEELCAWLSDEEITVPLPRDLFGRGSLLYQTEPEPALISVGPDGVADTDDDILLWQQEE